VYQEPGLAIFSLLFLDHPCLRSFYI